jgi:hypothetical protein
MNLTMKTSGGIVDRYLNSSSKNKQPISQSIILATSPPKSTKASLNNNFSFFPKNLEVSTSSFMKAESKVNTGNSTIKCQTIDLTSLLSKSRQ